MSNPQQILNFLQKQYSDAKYYLDFSTPLELFVAAILSPRVRDEIVNAATPDLFSRYKTARDYAEADLAKLEKSISNISLYRQKAAAIKEGCQILCEKYGGEVPNDLEALVELPRIGRKTAIAILSNAFDNVLGVVVDSHVLRVSQRLGLSSSKDADKVERDLEQSFARDSWKKLPWLIKAHGRAICKPTPLCSQCQLADICPRQGVDKAK